MLQSAFFNAILALSKGKAENHYSSLIDEIRNIQTITLDLLSVKMVQDLEVEQLIHYHNLLPGLEDLDVKTTLRKFQDEFIAYVEGLNKGLKIAFQTNLISNAYIHYPFIRFPKESNHYITTYFTSIDYYNGEKELWVTEAIPEDSYLLSSGFKTYDDYIDTCFFKVRKSIFVDNSIYGYANDFQKDREELCFVHNYILNNFILHNYGIAVDKTFKKITLLTDGVIEVPIPINNNKKRGKTVALDISSKMLLVALDFSEYGKYILYMKALLSETYCYECVYYAYEHILRLTKKKDFSEIESVQRQILADFLFRIMEKDDLNIRTDIKLILKRQEKYQKEDFLFLLSKLAGSFMGGFVDK